MKFELLQGDCLEQLRAMPSASVDAVICDPPYATTACKWDKPLDWAAIWPELWRVCKSEKSPVVLFSAQPFTTDLICSQRRYFRHEIIWEKTQATGFLDANRRPMRVHENVLLFCQRGSGIYNPQKTTGHKPYSDKGPRGSNVYGDFKHQNRHSDGERFPKSVLKLATVNNPSKVHPTQKPVEIMDWLTRSFSNAGDTILDFTAGSGSTGVAALQTGRNFIGIERDATYFEIARKRLNEAANTP